MSFDANYARYYDLLYADKDYCTEANYVLDVLRRSSHLPINSVLELGCGSGGHAEQFGRKGISVVGIDSSASMIAAAKTRIEHSTVSPTVSLCFAEGDIRTYRAPEKFSAVLSLFHVMSYQTSDQDLNSAIETAGAHLATGGVFLFDFWYGPAVLSDPPVVRVKHMSDDLITVTRIAEPHIDAQANTVDINYTIWVTDKTTGQIARYEEQHKMRYFFMPELHSALAHNGFEIDQSTQWFSDNPMSLSSWYGMISAHRN